jgi:hypothetical protein
VVIFKFNARVGQDETVVDAASDNPALSYCTHAKNGKVKLPSFVLTAAYLQLTSVPDDQTSSS